MRTLDVDKERSEKRLSLADFLESYNDTLPVNFPRASSELLKIFKKSYPSLFKTDGMWTLDQHRKKVMDWLPQQIKYATQ